MINIEQAKIIAYEHIKPRQEYFKKISSGDNLVLEQTIEFEEGWMFFFNSEKYLQTRDLTYRPIGGGPLVVGKEKGTVYQAGSGGTVTEWINEFREYLKV